MSPANQLVVSKRHIVLVAIAAFGGMITAMLATLAITIPVMGAQASSQLDQQAKQFAQVMSSQVQQTGSARQAAAGFDLGLPAEVCVQPGGQGAGGGQGAAARIGAGVGAGVVSADVHRKAEARQAQPVVKAAAMKHAPAKLVSEKRVANTTSNSYNNYNTYNDNDTYAVNSFNKDSYNQNSYNKTENNVDVKTEGKDNKVDVSVGSNNTNNAVVNDSYNTKIDQKTTVNQRATSNWKAPVKSPVRHDNKNHNDKRDHGKNDHRKDDRHDKKNDRHDRKDHKNDKKHDRRDDHQKHDKKNDNRGGSHSQGHDQGRYGSHRS